jgi:hypothetical protein
MKTTHRYIAAVLMPILCVQSAFAATPPAGYEDDVRLPQSNWFSDLDPSSRIGIAANYLADKAIIGGFADGTFRPHRLVNRAEMAKFITNADPTCPVDLSNDDAVFSDVLSGEWYVPYVNAAVDCNIIKGNDDGTFAPDRPVNTVELLAMVARANLGHSLPVRHTYEDVEESSWYSNYAGIAQKAKLFPEREEKRLLPSRFLTRGEVAYALYMILKPIDEPEPPIPCEIIYKRESSLDHPVPYPCPPVHVSGHITAPASVILGDDLIYKVYVKNAGKYVAKNITLLNAEHENCQKPGFEDLCTPFTLKPLEYRTLKAVMPTRYNPNSCNGHVTISHPIYVNTKYIGHTNTVKTLFECEDIERATLSVREEKKIISSDKSLVRFSAQAGETEDILLTDLHFRTVDVDPNATFSLWVDTDLPRDEGYGAVDTILQKGKAVYDDINILSFDEMHGGGYVIPFKATTTTDIFYQPKIFFDIRADSTEESGHISFAHKITDFIRAQELDNGSPLMSIGINDFCSFDFCQIIFYPLHNRL